jgi:GNAT superfamily N-acetyltransferase
MEAEVHKVPLSDIQDLRNLSLQENRFQFVHDKCYGAGWADTYIFSIGNETVGYGSVWGKDDRKARDTIFDFYLLRQYRKFTDLIFPKFEKVCGANFMECQTNNTLQSKIVFEYTRNINAEAILFEDSFQSELEIPDTVFKMNSSDDEGPGYVLEHKGQVVASGGYVRNYNFPYIDMYYEVKDDHRKKGFGSLFTQELKREAYRVERVPAARCNIGNKASKATLLKAGMKVCGHMLAGQFFY